jgi:hypothetical protein
VLHNVAALDHLATIRMVDGRKDGWKDGWMDIIMIISPGSPFTDRPADMAHTGTHARTHATSNSNTNLLRRPTPGSR